MQEKLITIDDVLAPMHTATEKDRALVRKAGAFAMEKHEGQKRHSGLPYYTHTFEVGKTLAEFGMNANVIAAGILHDVLEDCNVSKKTLEEVFNEKIAFYVDGVTRLGTIRYKGLDAKVKSLQKLLIATSKDLRVIIIKLADRLHNMETLHYIPSEIKRRRIAKETQKIYAPIADRLGVGGLKARLEELAFMELNSEEYGDLKARMEELLGQMSIANIESTMGTYLSEENQEVVIASRRKSVYSTYMKMKAKKVDLEEIHDIFAIRLVVKDIPIAYIVLGLLHRRWRSLPGTFKDYISFPKPNGYRALHTRILIDRHIVEVQILTEQMYDNSHLGKASHFDYKDKRHGIVSFNPAWFDLLLVSDGKTWLEKISAIFQGGDDEISLSNLEADFLQGRMFVFTPKGEVVDLPKGATVLDFAFAIHSDIGACAEGAFINNKYVSLQTELKNGDVLEIKTSKRLKVSEKWLNWVKTTEARTHIRRIIRKNS